MSYDQRAWLIAKFARHSLRKADPGKPFLLASGKKSTFYFDVKRTAQRSEVMRALREELRSIWLPMPAGDALAGVVLGGCHLATLLASSLDMPRDVIYVRKEPKDHGTGNLLEAPEPPAESDNTVILVEDVFTTGGSSKRAMDALKAGGYQVMGLIVVLDRRRPEDRTVTFEGVPLRSLFQLEDFGLIEDAE